MKNEKLQEEIQNKLIESKFKPRKELSIARGKSYRTPKGNTLRITVLSIQIDTNLKQGDMYIAGYINEEIDGHWTEKEFSCRNVEEFCDIYLNN